METINLGEGELKCKTFDLSFYQSIKDLMLEINMQSRTLSQRLHHSPLTPLISSGWFPGCWSWTPAEYVKALYRHPAYLTNIQSTTCEMLDWMKHKLESRLLGEINNLRYADDTSLMAESDWGTKELLDEGERGKWKGWLKTFKKQRSWHLGPSLHGK